MSNKRLGKGLEALIQPYRTEKIPEHHGVDKISIRSIKPNPYQPRQNFDETSLEELTASIKEKGILTPITVRKVGNQFILIALVNCLNTRTNQHIITTTRNITTSVVTYRDIKTASGQALKSTLTVPNG